MDSATPSDEVLDLIGALSMDRRDGAAAGNESRRNLQLAVPDASRNLSRHKGRRNMGRSER